jgi:hypothetical protein
MLSPPLMDVLTPQGRDLFLTHLNLSPPSVLVYATAPRSSR